MKSDELWEKYSDEEDIDGFPCEIMCKKDFLAALKEYGELVKAEAVKACRSPFHTSYAQSQMVNRSAAAIEKMELP